jgi:starvation-inducible DNA-binding protein
MGFTDKTREALARIFNHALREELQLSATTRSFVRHMTGPNSYSLHRLFDDQGREIEQWLEQIKQQARAAGTGPAAGAEDSVDGAADPVHEGSVLPRNMIGELLSMHEGVATRLREDLGSASNRLLDHGLADFFTRLVDFHETTAWMLRMLLEGSGTRR